MTSVSAWQRSLDERALTWLATLQRIRQALFFSALIVVLALSPSSYGRAYRPHLARHLYLGTVPIIGWFVLLGAIVCTVLIRVVLVSALSYGVSQYALELMVRMLVIELLPLAVAVYVALRCTLPFGEQVAHLHDPLLHQLRQEILPRVLAGFFAVIALIAISGVTALLLIYLASHGFSAAGLDSYTRLIGQVFDPSVTLIFSLKSLSLASVVALVPMLSNRFGARGAAQANRATARNTSEELQEMVQMFALVLAIEVIALFANYY